MCSDPGYVTRQYRDASQLNARIATEVEPLVTYLLSGAAADTAVKRTSDDEFQRRVSELVDRLEHELASRGTINITKDTGLFIARK